MNSTYTDILQQLEPYKDVVFYYALTEDEVLNIETNIGKRFPIYFREFLKVFGVRQDFVFGLLRKQADFIQQTEFLPEDAKKSFVIIGDNGGEDFWLLNSTDTNDTNIYEWQHWSDGEIVKIGYDFETLLKESLTKLSDKEIQRETNDKKNWCVQFAIPTENEQMIYSTIPLTLIQDWELKEVSPAQVRCYETKARLIDKAIKLKRQEYDGWSSPTYYFNLQEPVSNFGQKSLISDLDSNLKKVFPKYKLIDYGILSLTYEEE